MPESKPGLSTRAVHSGNDVDRKMVTRPKSLPIYESSVFVYDNLEQVDDFLAGNPDNYMYTRIANPNQAALEHLVRDLEGGEAALFSASGMAAVSAALLGRLSAGDHLIASRELYGTTQSLIEKELARFGISATLVEINDLAAVEAAITPATRIIYTETASNPLVRVSDIPALAEALEAHPKVARVFYPGLPSHPDFELARRLFPKGASGMLAFTLKGGLAEVDGLIRALRNTTFAPSLAGVASSITHPGKTSHRALSQDALAELDIHDGTIRVSVGIEDAADIVADFVQALDSL